MHENEKRDGSEDASSAGFDDLNIEKELGKRIGEADDGSIAVETDRDIDDIPNPKNLAEAEDELNYLKNALKNLKKEYDDFNRLVKIGVEIFSRSFDSFGAVIF